MVTYFNRKDLVSFGSYLLSEKRKSRFQESFNNALKDGFKNPLPVEEVLKLVQHADIENWMNDNKKMDLD